MNTESDDQPDLEYGVFEDTNNYVKYEPSNRDKMIRKFFTESRKRVEATSQQFNSHMIELFNK